MPRPGGTLVNVGEGGEAEATIPLDRWDRGGGGVDIGEIHIHGDVDSHERVRELADSVANVILAQTRTRRQMFV